MKIGILFDLDGTLLSTLEDLTDSVNETMRHFGCPERTLDEVRQFIGNGAANLIRLSLPGLDTDPSLETALAYYKAYYGTHSRIKTRPYDGILEALTQIKQEFPVAVVSNKPDRDTKPLVKAFFGEDVFALGENGDCPRKPAPDMLFRAMEAIGVEKCVYVGDSEVDVITAGNAGAPCLSVLWGFRDEACIRAHGGKHFCHTPGDLPEMLRQLAKSL